MKDLTSGFGNSQGTDKYYAHLVKGVVYTDGIREMCKALKCYWLLDVIASYQHKLIEVIYQTWIATIENRKGNVKCFDGDVEVICQSFDFMDLPDGEIAIVAVRQDEEFIIMALPVEG